MDTNQKKKENLIAALVLLAGLLGSVFYIFGRERAEFNLDYTDTLLWAAASVESKALISPDFWYAYIIPFSGSLLMIPLVMIFGVSYLTHELGMTVFILVLAAAVFFCVKAVGLNNGQSAVLTGLFLLLLLGSPITRMIYFGHVIHYSLAILFTCVSILLLNHTDKTPLYYILFVWCFLCSLNGSSALLLFLFPITGAIVLERLLDPKKLTLELNRVGVMKSPYSPRGPRPASAGKLPYADLRIKKPDPVNYSVSRIRLFLYLFLYVLIQSVDRFHQVIYVDPMNHRRFLTALSKGSRTAEAVHSRLHQKRRNIRCSAENFSDCGFFCNICHGFILS